MEPESQSYGERSIYIPFTSVGSPRETMNVLESKMIENKITIKTNAAFFKRTKK